MIGAGSPLGGEIGSAGLAILNSVSAQIAVVDRAGVIVAVNEAWLQQARENGPAPGVPAERCGVGVNYLDVCRASARSGQDAGPAKVLEALLAVLDRRLPAYSLEYPCHGPTRQRWFSLSITPLATTSGGAVVSHTEVTERTLAERALHQAQDQLERRVADRTEDLRQAKAALRESNELLAAFIERSPVYAYIKEATPTESRLLHASENFRQMLGRPGRELLGKPMQALFPPELAAKMTEDDWRVANGDSVLEVEEHFAGRTYLSLKFPVIQGEHRRLGGYTTDVTVRKREEAALRTSEAGLRAVFENVLQAFTLFEPDQTIRFFNRAASEAAERVTGKPLQVGASVADWIPPGDRASFDHHFACALKGECPRTERRFPTPSGERCFELHYAPVYEGPGRVTGVFYTALDVTERARTEEARRALEQQLQRAHKHESLERMAAGIAHQFNNHLAAIQGNLELAQPRSNQEVAVLLGEASDSVKRAAAISGAMLSYLGQGTLHRAPRDLSVQLAAELPGLESALPEGVRLEVAIDPRLPWCTTDVLGLRQVLHHLVLNAAEAVSPGGGTIRVCARPATAGEAALGGVSSEAASGEWACLEVSDQGAGMSPEILEQAFDPFFSTRFTGRGLGLAVVEGLVRAHSGAVRLQSAPGKGTTARVYLPASAPEELAARVAPSRPEPAGQRARAPAPGAVLVVDDDPPVLRTNLRLLRRLGHEVLAAPGGAEAVALVEAPGPSIGAVLLDLNMPGMDGWAVLAALRERRPDLYVVLASGYDVAQLRSERRAVTPDAWLQKPFTAEELEVLLPRAGGRPVP
jgi:PAS domain S-box-containing protein